MTTEVFSCQNYTKEIIWQDTYNYIIYLLLYLSYSPNYVIYLFTQTPCFVNMFIENGSTSHLLVLSSALTLLKVPNVVVPLELHTFYIHGTRSSQNENATFKVK